MGFILTLFYLFATLITPAEIMPILLPYRIMLVLLIVTLVASVFSVLSYRFSFKAPQFYLALALVGYAGLSVLWAIRWFAGAMDATFDLLFLLGISLMVCWTVGTLKRMRILVIVLSFVGAMIVTQGILAVTTGYREKEFVIKEGHGHAPGSGDYLTYVDRIRGLGRLNDPNDLAQFLIVDISLLGCFWIPRRAMRNFVVVIIPASYLLLGVALSRSRGAILALIVMLVMLLQKRMGNFGYVVGGVFGVLGIGAMAVLTGRDLSMSEDSAAGRLDAWYAGMQMFKSSPVFGVGFDRFTEHHYLTAHNSYMLCLAELGFPGFLIWLGILVSSLFQLRAIAAFPANTPAAADLKRTASSAYMATIMFSVTAWFLSRSYSTLLFIVIGIAIAITEIARREGYLPSVKTERVWKIATVFGGVAIVAAIYVTLRVRGLA
jgi:putative inorganic carbon (HCO3(-)) transporter